MLTTALTFIIGASAAGWILARLKMILIVGAAFILSNAGSFVFAYLKGYNSAANQCKVGELQRQLNEARRDLAAAKELKPKVDAELARQARAIENHDKETARYAEQLEKAERAAAAAEAKAASVRPKACPACPPARSCAVN